MKKVFQLAGIFFLFISIFSCGYERDNEHDPFNNNEIPAPESFNVSVSKDTVAAGETITVTGQVNGGDPSTQYSYDFRLKTPAGDSFQLLESRWDANTSSYSLAVGSDPGTYTIMVEVENLDNTWNSSTTRLFTVEPVETKTTWYLKETVINYSDLHYPPKNRAPYQCVVDGVSYADRGTEIDGKECSPSRWSACDGHCVSSSVEGHDFTYYVFKCE
ncbi:MAG: protein BatD [bacterium]|nr:protein BatD [bacterium]